MIPNPFFRSCVKWLTIELKYTNIDQNVLTKCILTSMSIISILKYVYIAKQIQNNMKKR